MLSEIPSYFAINNYINYDKSLFSSIGCLLLIISHRIHPSYANPHSNTQDLVPSAVA
jgi:hypothetical protein